MKKIKCKYCNGKGFFLRHNKFFGATKWICIRCFGKGYKS